KIMRSKRKIYFTSTIMILVVILIGAGVWFYKNMIDISGLETDADCLCPAISLEVEVADAGVIYIGQVEKISRAFSGEYTVTIRPEQTLKGEEITESIIQIKVEDLCPYPFQKNGSYMFFASDRSRIGRD